MDLRRTFSLHCRQALRHPFKLSESRLVRLLQLDTVRTHFSGRVDLCFQLKLRLLLKLKQHGGAVVDCSLTSRHFKFKCFGLRQIFRFQPLMGSFETN